MFCRAALGSRVAWVAPRDAPPPTSPQYASAYFKLNAPFFPAKPRVMTLVRELMRTDMKDRTL